MIEVSVDTSGFEKKIIELSVYTKKSVGVEMNTAARGLGVQLARYTQPFDFKDSSRESGNNAIKRDVLRVFYVLPDTLCQNPVPIDSGQYAGWLRLFTTKQGMAYAVKREGFRINDENQTLYRHHQESRNRNGIVPRDRNIVDKQANFAAINLWVITETQFATYLPFVQTEVGFAKAGWITAVSKLGDVRGIPSWVTRHKGKAPGSVDDHTKDENPYVIIRNDVNYTDRVLSESGKRGALRDTEFRLAKRIQAALDHPPKEK